MPAVRETRKKNLLVFLRFNPEKLGIAKAWVKIWIKLGQNGLDKNRQFGIMH
jgi:hypothetical protein